ncbi:hypothetical protein Clacol_008062 [Clathrus columnatus]|uniref:AB hydrolase-1 domain-containing protein n=1 Tax=Clathrus columnatus TaxID=1419009 RepID=A0AAV5ALS1_9AGAM|nr:hypothetical protein Clacol_008062 [Clathrus columnatus]
MATTTILADLPPARAIPMTFRDSFRSWWAVGEKESLASEERLLRNTPASNPAPPVTASSSFVHLSKHSQYINTLSILPNTQNSQTPPAVLLHGYGAGLGFFFHNFASLGDWVKRRNTPVYALDWLGMGRSARVPFKIKSKKEDIPGRVSEAEGFFIDSLEEWRQKMGIERMTLVGHSLGAYLSVAYAIKYPNRVARLVLLSPAGVPHDADTSVPSKEMDATPNPGTDASIDDAIQPARRSILSRIRTQQKVEKRREGSFARLMMHLWEEGWSPFQVVRYTLFWGPLLVGKYSSRRFAHLTEEETRNMHDYILNITLAKGSGEYCISHILSFGAHARMPLVDRVSVLTNIPITFVYGDHDWMDPEGGARAVENLRGAGNRHAKTVIIKGAGHHVYLDNAPAVNELLTRELDKTVVEDSS